MDQGIRLGPLPAGFLEQFIEVAEGVCLRDAETILRTDPEVGRWLRDYVMDLVAVSGDDPMSMIEHLATGMMSTFLAGRLHALRGYPTTLPPADDDCPDSWGPAQAQGPSGTGRHEQSSLV